ncbi:hypothetical protein [Streptomyces sp. NPDC048720]|uniref:hypothetical protein n=1 Tax=Streptomyces sp. NPDC048720 TaxID=3365588 RepID=UPI00371F8667
MSENTTSTQQQPSTDSAKAERPTIAALLSQTGLPDMALKPITGAVDSYTDLVSQVNKWVAEINAAKAKDPNNVEYLDSLWKAEQDADNPKVAEIAAEFDAVAERYEKLLTQLRGIAKENFIPEQLSEEAAKEKKAKVNSAQPTLTEARNALKAQFMIPESMLGMLNVPLPEGGLVSLLPTANSLKGSGRGRKAAGNSGGGVTYMTRVGDVLIDGKSTRTEKGGKIDYAAAELSKRWNKAEFPGNGVTGEELEEALFAKLGIPVRSAKLQDVQDRVEVTFTKDVVKRNPQDGSEVSAPETVTLTFVSTKAWDAENAPAEDKAESDKPAEGPADTNMGGNEAPAPKAESKPAANEGPAKPSTNAAAKKATPAPKK